MFAESLGLGATIATIIAATGGVIGIIFKFVIDLRKLRRDQDAKAEEIKHGLRVSIAKLNGGLVHVLDGLPYAAWVKQEQIIDVGTPRERRVFIMLHINEAYEKLFGIALHQYQGREDSAVWSADIARAFRNNDIHILDKGEREIVTEPVVVKDGDSEEQECLMQFIKLPIVNGPLRGVMGLILPHQ